MFKNITTNSWGYFLSNIDNINLTTTALGTSLSGAPSNNTKSSYIQIFSSSDIVYDCYWISIGFNSAFISGAVNSILVTIGIDYSGGTSYVDLITDMVCGGASNMSGSDGGGMWYSFPIHIPAGASLAAKYQSSNILQPSPSIIVTLCGQPSRPDLINFGTKVETIGVNTASSTGTSVANTYTWTSIGTTSNKCFWWQCGVQCNDSTSGNSTNYTDISYGDGTNYQVILTHINNSSNTEYYSYFPTYCPYVIPSGSNLYARADVSVTTTNSYDVALYGVVC